MDVFLNIFCGFLFGIFVGGIGMVFLIKQYDLKGWCVARKYRDLYDQLMENYASFQDAIQKEEENE